MNWLIVRKDGTNMLPGASYYWFFTAVMALAACVYVAVAMLYQEGPTFRAMKPRLTNDP
ncbi:MAG: hypothetical protein R3B91_13325 [Planctomycetaceae bacterium]